MNKPFSTYIPQPSLDFCPGGTPAKFWVAVQNNSSDYASFQLDLHAAGEDHNEHRQIALTWYRLVSGDSYNIPPKDCIKFEVEILTLPPGRAGFVGILFLQANISSPELNHHESQTLKLCVTGIPPELNLDTANLQTASDTQIQIAVDIKNPNDQPISMALRLTGLPPDWLTQAEKNIILQPKATQTISFHCQIPAATKVPQGHYPFSADVLQSGTVTVSRTALLEVIQSGQVTLRCDTPHQQVPTQAGRWFNRHRKPATFTLTGTNQSNVAIQGKLDIQPISSRRRLWQKLLPRQSKILKIEPIPNQITLPLSQESISQVTIDYRPPWFGWGCYQEFKIQEPQLQPAVEVHNPTPVLSLTILPVLSRWLQGLGILGLLILSWILLAQGHRATITHAQFPHQIGQNSDGGNRLRAHNVISGAENGTLLAWPLRSHLPWLLKQYFSPYNPERKAIEVVRYSPDDRQVAVGFNNGEIDIYEEWSSDKTPTILKVEEPDGEVDKFEGPCHPQEQYLKGPQVYSGDRVYDLAFSHDGQSLYSAHGSGRILKWQQAKPDRTPECFQASYLPALDNSQRNQDNTTTAITLVKVAGKSFLATAGQRNHLNLLDLDNPSQWYPLSPSKNTDSKRKSSQPIREDDHITSLDTPVDRPAYLAAADDQGNITLWDLETCLENLQSCQPTDQWQGHGGKPIRSVSLSDNGCYLASAGDDGQVKLWPLSLKSENDEITFRRVFGEELVVRKSRQRFSPRPRQLRPLETVDLVRSKSDQTPDSQDKLLIVSGGEDRQVHLQMKHITHPDAHLDTPSGNSFCKDTL